MEYSDYVRAHGLANDIPAQNGRTHMSAEDQGDFRLGTAGNHACVFLTTVL